MIRLEEHPEGVVLSVRAQPGGRKSAVRGEQNGMLKVSVTAAPEKGKANEAIVEVLADTLGVRRGQIELIAGHTSKQKRFVVRGIAHTELAARIEAVLTAL